MDIEVSVKSLIKQITSSENTAKLYTSLLLRGPQTISALSRSSQIERTKVYRMIEEMEQQRLIYIEVQPNRQIIHAVSLKGLEELVEEKIKTFSLASDLVKKIEEQIIKNRPFPSETHVKFFKGIDGLKQMLWNQTSANGIILSILSENIQSHCDEAFFIRWIEKCNIKNINGKSIVDDNFINQQKDYYNGKFSYSLKNWEARKIPKSVANIPHRTTVYDNVTAYFSWEQDDLFGIEIYNQNIADTQRQFFELLWQKSTKIDK